MAYSSVNLENLVKGEIDVAFIVPMETPPEVAVKPIGRRALMLALPTDHPLAKLERVPASSLRRVPIIMWPQSWNPQVSSSFRQWVVRHTGEEPNIVAEEPADQAFEAIAMDGSAVPLATSCRASPATTTAVVFRQMAPQPQLSHQIAYMREDRSPTLQHLLLITDEIIGANHANAPEGELL